MTASANQVITLTAPGVSAIAAVRLRGPGVAGFLQTHFSAHAAPGRAVHGRLVDAGRELDDPVVVLDPSRQTADIFCHGGRWVVRSILDLAQREGFTLVSPVPVAEFAVDAEGLLEQEILQYLPQARTREAIATLLAQADAQARLANASADVVRAALDDRSLHWLLNPPRIAIIGIPNAGKSTLANALLARESSIVADLPGTTRDYVEAYANLGGLAVLLVDTPGMRQSDDRLEMNAIDVSAAYIADADLHILLLDPTQPESDQTRLQQAYPGTLTVWGKRDLARAAGGLQISAGTGEGLDRLAAAIRRHFQCETLPHGRPVAWTVRQRLWLQSLLDR